MRTLATYIFRAIWLLLAFAWGWQLARGKTPLPIDMFNVGLTAAIVLGTITSWLRAPSARTLAGIFGVIVSFMLGYQVWSLMTMFSGFSDVKITASYGPFELEGEVARTLLWLHPLLLFAFSVEVLIAERRSRRDGNEAESA
jgi:hypothetical protein